ncbi:MAG: flagellar hook-associated protein 3, partial [Proteobacteria bacterium]|nr:flagellar hook-associated protein 3 [Pseudomonadota bacterium]
IPIEINDGTPAVPVIKVDLTGTPAVGDTVQIKPAGLMSGIDSAIQGIGDATDSSEAAKAVAKALERIDLSMERLHNVRGYAGELLNRADRITGDQSNRSIQLEADRSRAEDLDMMKGISDFQNANTGYEAALKSYAQVQRLSLFNYING